MPSAELKFGYEQVFTVTEYYDGPRQGIANFRGQPHFYNSLFDEAYDAHSNLYRLTPITPDIFDLAKEDWAIWQRWELAFHAGKTTLESHPVLPEDRARHEEIKTVLELVLQTVSQNCIIRAGSFEATSGDPKGPIGGLRRLQVKWTEPSIDSYPT